jgi:hypothetical protein
MVETRRRNYNQPVLPALEPAIQSDLDRLAQPARPTPQMSDQGDEEQPAAEEEAERLNQVGNRALPRDAYKLPIFRGEELDVQQLETFLIALRRYFRVNHASYANDPGDSIKLASIAQCFPLTSLARLWYDDVEETFDSYDEFEIGLRENFAAGEANLIKLQQSWEQARQGKYSARDFYHHLLKLRMRITAVDSNEKPSDREFLRKFCANLREPAKSEISKKRISEPNLSLPQLVKLAELEDKPIAVASAAAALRAFQFDKKQGSASNSKDKFCFYCPKSRNHTHEECRRIAARKAAGTWQERPPPKK